MYSVIQSFTWRLICSCRHNWDKPGIFSPGQIEGTGESEGKTHLTAHRQKGEFKRHSHLSPPPRTETKGLIPTLGPGGTSVQWSKNFHCFTETNIFHSRRAKATHVCCTLFHKGGPGAVNFRKKFHENDNDIKMLLLRETRFSCLEISFPRTTSNGTDE